MDDIISSGHFHSKSFNSDTFKLHKFSAAEGHLKVSIFLCHKGNFLLSALEVKRDRLTLLQAPGLTYVDYVEVDLLKNSSLSVLRNEWKTHDSLKQTDVARTDYPFQEMREYQHSIIEKIMKLVGAAFSLSVKNEVE